MVAWLISIGIADGVLTSHFYANHVSGKELLSAKRKSIASVLGPGYTSFLRALMCQILSLPEHHESFLRHVKRACTICMIGEPLMVLIPCGHKCLCAEWAEEMQ